MSEPTLCSECSGAGYPQRCDRGAGFTCVDQLELYRDGIRAERARVRSILAKHRERLRTFDGYVLPTDALDAILSGAEMTAAEGPREGASGE